MKTRYLLLLAGSLFFALHFYSCEKDEIVDWSDQDQLLLDEIDQLTAEVYTADLAGFDLQQEMDDNVSDFVGKRPCFRFVFPIKFAVANQDALVVIHNYKELREFLAKWKNSTTVSDAVKPKLVFPVKVKLRNGKFLLIKSPEGFAKLKKRCSDQKPDLPKFRLCFDPVFPVFLSIPTQDGLFEVNSKQELFELLKKWKLNHPDAATGPSIVFPITVKTFDGAFKEIKSMEELKKYLKDCLQKLHD